MGIWVVQKQMIIIFALILMGVYLYKCRHLSDESVRHLSWLIVNVTNPVMLLCAAFAEEQKVSAKDIGVAFLCFFMMYAILMILAYIIPVLLGVEKDMRYSYRMLTIVGNVGFIGIPFSAAVLGNRSLIFVSVCGLVINMIIYTYGTASFRKTAAAQHPDEVTEDHGSLKNIINSGTVLAVVTIIVYLTDIKVPDTVRAGLGHIGNCTTFLSMAVLGTSVARMIPKEVFSKWRLYVFVIIRQILVPLLITFILRPFVDNSLLLSTVAVMSAMPAGNMPLMMSKQYGVREDIISAGIILTTISSVITIPVVMYFL